MRSLFYKILLILLLFMLVYNYVPFTQIVEALGNGFSGTVKILYGGAK
ncbi:exported hypothetical protein [Candidatus Desulfosporosinus infrequens]|uniref:Uncharacterized protein n=1 Tax=Candidatus Desulfosporosinus infrequens TaxID=2043169 RepID=A0A2U3LL53_9FIRM|nr:exported hypothetical protein [Candidatus Desulfosporosinus infrequens]